MNNKYVKMLKLCGWFGIVNFLSYLAAVVFSPMAYPGYDWMSQAVSDLSAESAPSRILWNQLSALYGGTGLICVMAVTGYAAVNKAGNKLFRLGIYLFTIMNWISSVGYTMFPLTEAGKDISGFQSVMHICVTAAVVVSSIVSLVLIIIGGLKTPQNKGLAIWAAVALSMMFVGAAGTNAVPPQYFGIVERFSVFAAVGYQMILGIYLLRDGIMTENAV